MIYMYPVRKDKDPEEDAGHQNVVLTKPLSSD